VRSARLSGAVLFIVGRVAAMAAEWREDRDATGIFDIAMV
jgi:hypothetical protein